MTAPAARLAPLPTPVSDAELLAARLRWVRQQNLKSHLRQTLTVIAQLCGPTGNLRISRGALGQEVGCVERTARYHVTALAGMGLLRCTPDYGPDGYRRDDLITLALPEIAMPHDPHGLPATSAADQLTNDPKTLTKRAVSHPLPATSAGHIKDIYSYVPSNLSFTPPPSPPSRERPLTFSSPEVAQAYRVVAEEGGEELLKTWNKWARSLRLTAAGQEIQLPLWAEWTQLGLSRQVTEQVTAILASGGAIKDPWVVLSQHRMAGLAHHARTEFRRAAEAARRAAELGEAPDAAERDPEYGEIWESPRGTRRTVDAVRDGYVMFVDGHSTPLTNLRGTWTFVGVES